MRKARLLIVVAALVATGCGSEEKSSAPSSNPGTPTMDSGQAMASLASKVRLVQRNLQVGERKIEGGYWRKARDLARDAARTVESTKIEVASLPESDRPFFTKMADQRLEMLASYDRYLDLMYKEKNTDAAFDEADILSDILSSYARLYSAKRMEQLGYSGFPQP